MVNVLSISINCTLQNGQLSVICTMYMYHVYVYVPCICICTMLSHFSRVQLIATLWTVAHQAPLSMGILQARILEWVAMPYSRGSSQPRDQTHVSCIAGRFFTIWATREALPEATITEIRKSILVPDHQALDYWGLHVWAQLLSHDSCNPMDCSPPGSSVLGIL